MAATPVTCPADTWTLVASSVQRATIEILKNGYYLQFWVDAGGGAPVGDDVGAAYDPERPNFEADRDCDLYIYCRNDDGEVRVDT